jgi:hypothetical protein
MIFLYIVGLVLFVSFGMIVFRGAPYVPTHRAQIATAFDELYPLSDKDYMVDLGSGDGVVLRAAADRGARALGYELNPVLVALCWLRFRRDRHVQVCFIDYQYVTTLPRDATVVYAFGTSLSIQRIARKLEQWSQDRTLYFISYGFTLEDRKPLKRSGPMSLYRFDLRA